jgi:hypothetical protein
MGQVGGGAYYMRVVSTPGPNRTKGAISALRVCAGRGDVSPRRVNAFSLVRRSALWEPPLPRGHV